MTNYSKKFEIYCYDVNKDGYVTPTKILNYLNETSICHTNYLGFGFKKLIEQDLAWILNRWKVEINKYPRYNEFITIETWASGLNKFYGTREFRILDQNNIEIGRASSVWILINISKKRPVRIPSYIYEKCKIQEDGQSQLTDFYDFEDDINIKSSIDFHVRKSDIDLNNHVNNTKYLSWILEIVPDEIVTNYILNEFEIVYKKEITYGKTILSGLNELKHLAHNVEILHKIFDKDINETNALARTYLGKK